MTEQNGIDLQNRAACHRAERYKLQCHGDMSRVVGVDPTEITGGFMYLYVCVTRETTFPEAVSL